jgi:hypothetical protein
MHPAGLRLRQAREKLGLTYREVERATPPNEDGQTLSCTSAD